MKQPVLIGPSILAANFANLGEEIQLITKAGADFLHLDVMDGHFVPVITIGPQMIKAVRPHSTLPFDTHLMIMNTVNHVEMFAHAGSDTIIIHPEEDAHIHRSIQKIKELGKKVGVALNPGTHPIVIDNILGDLDLILVMTVNPGFGGQKFITSQLDKIVAIRQRIDQLNIGKTIDLEVDGGINFDTASLVVKAGANRLVAGTAVFGGGSSFYAPNIKKLKEAALK
ncbi:MAG: ribulose-phosphate 3-epimerase [Alphaproteobacteria bacterium]|nr:ribulose-phosphate 3-epimerase [Alphaproteobacteria bacterium]